MDLRLGGGTRSLPRCPRPMLWYSAHVLRNTGTESWSGKLASAHSSRTQVGVTEQTPWLSSVRSAVDTGVPKPVHIRRWEWPGGSLLDCGMCEALHTCPWAVPNSASVLQESTKDPRSPRSHAQRLVFTCPREQSVRTGILSAGVTLQRAHICF